MNALIIDGSQYKAEEIKDILKNLGFLKIDFAETTFAAIQCLKNNSYELIILDNCMPCREDDFPKQNEGIRFLKRCSMVDSYKEFIGNAKIILCSSEDVNIAENLSAFEEVGFIGTIKYDSSVYLNPVFEELIKKGGLKND